MIIRRTGPGAPQKSTAYLNALGYLRVSVPKMDLDGADRYKIELGNKTITLRKAKKPDEGARFLSQSPLTCFAQISLGAMTEVAKAILPVKRRLTLSKRTKNTLTYSME
jgi:hypothetical protein